MTPERKALDRIAAVLDHEGAAIEPPTYVTLRAILAEVTPEPGGDMQSPLALPGDMQSFGPETYRSGGVLDRDALLDLMEEHIDGILRGGKGPFADSILALVRPVAGVVLTPEEVARVGQWHTYAVRYMTQADDALAARLEAAQ